MKTKFIFLVTVVTLFLSCKKEVNNQPSEMEQVPETEQTTETGGTFYKNLNTNEIITYSQYEEFVQNTSDAYMDSINGRPDIMIYFLTPITSNDSTIIPFNYDLRVGNEYIVRANSSEKIGLELSAKTFSTIDGEKIQIGGTQEKPMFINLWFVKCGGCIAEMPLLNMLYDKYADKVNFVSMTFDNKKDVNDFLKKKEFKFKHIADVSDYIDYIGSKPYPENIFIGKDGTIKYVEGGLPIPSSNNEEEKREIIKYFESLIDNMLAE